MLFKCYLQMLLFTTWNLNRLSSIVCVIIVMSYDNQMKIDNENSDNSKNKQTCPHLNSALLILAKSVHVGCVLNLTSLKRHFVVNRRDSGTPFLSNGKWKLFGDSGPQSWSWNIDYLLITQGSFLFHFPCEFCWTWFDFYLPHLHSFSQDEM